MRHESQIIDDNEFVSVAIPITIMSVTGITNVNVRALYLTGSTIDQLKSKYYAESFDLYEYTVLAK
jgi:hypothetical protein